MSELVYSANEEDFESDIDCVIDHVLYNCTSMQEVKESFIFIGEPVKPIVKADWLLDYLKEKTQECVYHQVGEYADNFEAKTNYDLALKTHLQEWINKLSFNCYTVKNVRAEPITNYLSEQELQEYFKA